jgi:glutamate-1-semialdehyde 2,1-aminomutase
MSDLPRSTRAFEAARALIPGGVNSPVRAFGAVGGTPRFIASARGARITDVDGNEFVDYVGSWGPMILGHRDDGVLRAIQGAAERGWSYGAPTEAETELARKVCDLVPSVERVRMVNSGTEATLSALRLARAWTGRDRIVKFSGCYHGHHDALLVAAGSGLATFGTPSSPGVTASTTADTVICRFNDLDSVDEAFRAHGDQIACIIVEPVAGNMGVVAPAPGFLEGLRQRCDDTGAVLVFDEVMTGFRVARGGAQERFGVTPDLTTMGKVIGGGLPVGAYGGRAEIMERISPAGDVYQAGTLSGNPLAMAAGLATLAALESGDAYRVLEARAAAIEDGLAPARDRHAGRVQFARVGSMFTLFFADGPVRNFDDASSCDVTRHAAWFHALLERGVYMPPSQFEACFVSLAHTEDDVRQTVAAVSDALDEVLGG